LAIVTKTSSSPDTITLIAGENLSQYDYVFIAHPTAGYTFFDGIIVSRAYKTRKDIRTRGANAKCVGFAIAAANVGDPVVVKTKGYLAGQSGLTAGRVYQPSATPGAIELFDGLKQYHPNVVGVAISTTELIIYDQVWRQRGRGYICAGHVSGPSNLVESFSFSNLTSYNLPVLGQNKKWPGCSASYFKVYVSGGSVNDNGSSPHNQIYSIPLANDTNSTNVNLTVSRCLTGSSYSPTKSYCLGGSLVAYNGNSMSNVVDGLTFSSEVCANVTTISQARGGLGSAPSALKIYNCGGGTSVVVNTIDALTLSSETVSALSSTLTTSRWIVGGCSSTTKSYVGGGHTNIATSTQTNNIEALTFSNETIASVTTFVNVARGQLASIASFTKAYFPGGYTGTVQKMVDEMSFSTETGAGSLTLLGVRCSYGGTQI
jgi:hypothetical protein